MPRNNAAQFAFTKGEISPLAAGRADVNLYQLGAKTIENLIVRPQGPVFRRSGTKFIRSTKFNTQKARIIPFTVSDETAYELEFGSGYIHFYKNKEPLFETTTTEVEAWTVLNDGGLMQISASADDLPGWGDLSILPGAPADNGTAIQSAGTAGRVRITTSVPHTLRTGVTVYMASTADPNSINNQEFVINRISAYAVDLVGTTFVSVVGVTDTAIASHGLLPGDRVFFSGGPEYPELTEQFHTVKTNLVLGVGSSKIFTVANVAFANHGVPTGEEVHTIPIEIVTTFTEDELADIHYVQSADVLYIFHPAHKPQKLVRLDDDGDRNDWLLADVDFQDGPYLDLNNLAPNIDTTTPANGATYLDVYLEVSSYAHTANVTAAAVFAGAAADQNLYLEYRQGDQWRLAKLTSASSSITTGTVDIIDNVMLFLDSTTILTNRKSPGQNFIPGTEANSASVGSNTPRVGYGPDRFKRIDPNNEVQSGTAGTAAGGTLTSQYSGTFGIQDVGKYIRYTDLTAGDAYWALITKIPTATTGGSKATHARPLAGSPGMVTNNSTGKFVITGEARTGTVKSFRNGATFAAFASTDVGRHIRLAWGGRWVWGKITAFTSTSQVTVTFYSDIPRDPHDARKLAGSLDGTTGAASTTGRTYDWRLGAWSATTGWPTVGVFHEQRLWLAGTTVQPQTIWGSVSGDFENFPPTEIDSTVLDDNAVTVTLGSAKANAIKWLVSGPALTIGTSGGEWQMRANSSINEAITPANVKATEYTGHGSKSETIPARVGSAILFVDRSGEKVYKVFYSYEKDALDSDDLTVISEHIIREHGGAVASAFQQKPHGIYWVACGDGTLAGMTQNEKQEVVAWHHHTIQGGLVEDVSVIPSADASEDEVWLVVNRTINGSTARYIEVLESDFYPASSSSRLGMKFLDSHQYITGFTGTVITGLNHLEAQSVVVVKDGVRIAGTFTVASGAVTITSGATSELLVGLNGSADLVSLPPEGGSAHGTSQGQQKRIVHLDCRFYNTSSVSFGPSLSSLITKTLPVIAPTVWFSGTNRLLPASGFDAESVWAIRQSDPLPLNVLFVVAVIETNE